MIEEMVDVYFKVFPFLHADDTVESTQQLQNQLNHFETIARSRI